MLWKSHSFRRTRKYRYALHVTSLVMLPIPWLRSGRGSLPVQVSGGRKIQNAVLHPRGMTGFSGWLWTIFASSFPLGSALVRLRSDLSGAMHDSRHGGVRSRLSLQIGPGQGFEEDKLCKCSVDGHLYTFKEGKSRRNKAVWQFSL
jgi:hypothetical protein